MDDEIFDTLSKLCGLRAPSGYEGEICSEISKRWGATSELDPTGSLLFHIGGDGPKTLIHAHADQVGYVVISITDDGFLFLDTAQGVRGLAPEKRWPVGTAACVRTSHGQWIDGLFAAASGHVTRSESTELADLRWSNFWVDMGFSTREQALDSGIHIGSPVVFRPQISRLGSSSRVFGTSMDDRVGLCAMDLLLARIKEPAKLPCQLWFGVTTQEESGMHGAHAMATNHRFDRVVGLEVGLVGDLPGIDQLEFPGRLGGGPMVVHQDGMLTYSAEATFVIRNCASSSGIPFQDVVFPHYASDGLGFLDNGSPAALIAVPTRYTHTAFETIDLVDIGSTVDLLECLVWK